jgi:hypothetical protein
MSLAPTSQFVIRCAAAIVAITCLPLPTRGHASESATRAGHELFEKKIRPALIRYCYECHAADSSDVGGELLLDSPTALRRGGETGPAVVPGNPRDSLLQRAIEYRDLEMPPDEKMPDDVIAAFRRWIALGAPDPRKATDDEPQHVAEKEPEQAVDLWSLRPVERKQPPQVSDEDWVFNDIDRFVLSRLRDAGLEPNEDADPATLLRRLYFDLIGLPPSPQAVRAFAADPSDDHFESIVDRLLASPQFGERWGRHWLDVARYAESAGSSRDVLMLYAWRYRDYVIDSLTEDVPFDRFITEQIAGDLLDAESEAERQRQLIATGLLAIGSKSLNGGNLTYDIIDDQIDVITKSVLGMTVSCARCHDHKFDPIPTRDYYSLAGFFLSTDTRYGGGTKRPKSPKEKAQEYLVLDRPLSPEEAEQRAETLKKAEQLNKQVAASQKRVKTLAAKVPAEFRGSGDQPIPESVDAAEAKTIRQYQVAVKLLKKRRDEQKEIEASLGPEPTYALGVQDAEKIADARVLVRGEKNQPGDTVARGFLSALGNFCDPGTIDDDNSGRLQLAAWLVHPDNPLTPRVAVNRVWQHLMGSGLVETVDNFGVTGASPSHPELLDFLAAEFVQSHRWSIKQTIRQVVTSRVYRLSSRFDEEAFAVDPDNRLRWRMPRRRLEAEPLRDAMLTASGQLDLARPEGSLVMQIGEGEVGRNLNTSVLEEPFDHRSVYLPIIRGIIPESLRLFDFPEPSNVQGVRDSNTTPTQSLFLMNSEFAIRVASRFADRLLTDSALKSDADRVREAYLLCFAIEPSSGQVERDLRYIRDMLPESSETFDASRSGDPSKLAWTTYCQSLLASARFRFID